MQAHKAGRKAGQSARQKHAEKKGGRMQFSPAFPTAISSTLFCSCGNHESMHITGGRAAALHNTGRLAQSRAERMNAAKLQR